jgi:molecular chaperone DnaK
MKAEAEANAESDRLEKEKVDKVNMADNLIFQTEKQMKEFDDKLTEDDKSALKSDLTSLREAHSSQDVDKIDEASNKLNETWSTISTRLYQQSNESNVEETTQSGSDDVEDTSFEEVE